MHIVEVGPRDGLQNERRTLSTESKLAYIDRLIAAGITRMEAVSFARPDRVPQMADAEAVMAGVPRDRDVSYIGLVMNARGADRAIATGVDEANIVVVSSETFSQRNQGMSIDASISALPEMVTKLSNAGIRTTVTLGAAFGCPFEGEVALDRVVRISESVAATGIVELGLADTIGVAVPRDIRSRIQAVREVTDLPLRLHLHNTRNTGYANAIAALDAGVETLDASSGGIGGCPFAPNATGNIATEDLIYAAERSGYSTGLDFDAVIAAAAFVTAELGITAPALLGRAGIFPAA